MELVFWGLNNELISETVSLGCFLEQHRTGTRLRLGQLLEQAVLAVLICHFPAGVKKFSARSSVGQNDIKSWTSGLLLGAEPHELWRVNGAISL